LDRATETLYRLWLKKLLDDPKALLDLTCRARKEWVEEESDCGFEDVVGWILNCVKWTIRVIAKEMGVKGE